MNVCKSVMILCASLFFTPTGFAGALGAADDPLIGLSAIKVSRQASAAAPTLADRTSITSPLSKDAERINPLLPIVNVVRPWAWLMLALLVLIVCAKALNRKKRLARNDARRGTPDHRSRSKNARISPVLPVKTDLPGPSIVSALPSLDPAPPTQWSMDLLRTLEWKRFEELVERFWVLKGLPARLTAAGADGGIDVVIADQRDPAQAFAVAQCKSWTSKPVGVEPVRALWGSTHHFTAKLALFYGLSGFTDDAKAFAAGKHLKLISGEDMLMQIRSMSESDQAALLGHVTRGDYITPTCPKCDIKMVRKQGKAGKADFWGCERFRTCGAKLIPMRS